MLLNNKHAVIFGAGGSLGSTVARAFAKAGASVHLSGIHLPKVQLLAEEIIAGGGSAYFAEVDALNIEEVEAYLQSLNAPIDVCFNAIGWKDVQGKMLTEMSVEDFLTPINNATRSNFITSTAAGRYMMTRGKGVILTLTATPGGIGYANVGGFGPACCAVESMVRDLGSELGPWGIRVVNIRSGGSPDSAVFKNALAEFPEVVKEFMEKMTNDTMLKQLPLMEDIAQTAVFLVSDMASKITGCTIDVTGGTTSALNYKVTPITFANR